MILTPKRKLYTLAGEKEINTLIKKTRVEITNRTDTRNEGYFDYRLRIPGGADATDTEEAAIRIVGTDFQYVDSSGARMAITGTLDGATGASPYYIWIEGVNFRYIDSSGNERYFADSAYCLDTFPYTFPFYFSGECTT